MARQKGIIPLKGQLGELSFYFNRQYGYLVRQKGGPSSERVAKDPVFARTRENASEFAIASSCGKLIRQAVKTATGLKGDGKVAQGLVSLLLQLAKNDSHSERGKRKSATVFDDATARELLSNFVFITGNSLAERFFGRISCDIEHDLIRMETLETGSSFKAPSSASHVKLTAAILCLDFEAMQFKVLPAPTQVVRLDSNSDLSFSCAPEPNANGSRIGVVSLVFMQEMNGDLYPLEEGKTVGLMS